MSLLEVHFWVVREGPPKAREGAWYLQCRLVISLGVV